MVHNIQLYRNDFVINKIHNNQFREIFTIFIHWLQIMAADQVNAKLKENMLPQCGLSFALQLFSLKP